MLLFNIMLKLSGYDKYTISGPLFVANDLPVVYLHGRVLRDIQRGGK